MHISHYEHRVISYHIIPHHIMPHINPTPISSLRGTHIYHTCHTPASHHTTQLYPTRTCNPHIHTHTQHSYVDICHKTATPRRTSNLDPISRRPISRPSPALATPAQRTGAPRRTNPNVSVSVRTCRVCMYNSSPLSAHRVGPENQR
jgi:hypothetical protein